MDKPITNALIFKDGFYWLARHRYAFPEGKPSYTDEEAYVIITEDEFEVFGINRNGFEFASDAYAYIASLQPKQEPEYNDREEERLKETGKV